MVRRVVFFTILALLVLSVSGCSNPEEKSFWKYIPANNWVRKER
jgi:hypothetical protein